MDLSHIPNNIPIIGQPQIVEWSVTLVLACVCKAPLLLEGKVGATAACRCGRAYRNSGFTLNASGQLDVQLSMQHVRVEEPAAVKQ